MAPPSELHHGLGRPRKMAELDGKVALVTGAASGISAACTEALAGARAKVVVTDIQDIKGEELVAAIAKAGGQARRRPPRQPTSEEAWIEVIDGVRAEFARLDILVNNAGIGLERPGIVDMSLADFRRQHERSTSRSVFLGVKHGLKRAGSGHGEVDHQHVVRRRPQGRAATLAGYCATRSRAALHQGRGAGMRRVGRGAGQFQCTRASRTPIWLGILNPGGAGANARLTSTPFR